MKRSLGVCGLTLAGLALAGAAPVEDPFDLVRQGNAAFARGEYREACGCYEQAGSRITDPGLTAFNRATALYQLGEYREAELHYQSCLADASGPRRARALYGLGNCLLQRDSEGDSDILREAVRAYTECLREEALDPQLAADARHNLELAKLLLARAGPNKKPPDSNNPKNGTEPKGKEPEPSGSAQSRQGTRQPDPRGPATPAQPEAGQDPVATQQPPPPGAGALPPLPDRAEPASLASADAEQHLNDAVERIKQERRTHRYRSAAGAGRDVLD